MASKAHCKVHMTRILRTVRISHVDSVIFCKWNKRDSKFLVQWRYGEIFLSSCLERGTKSFHEESNLRPWNTIKWSNIRLQISSKAYNTVFNFFSLGDHSQPGDVPWDVCDICWIGQRMHSGYFECWLKGKNKLSYTKSLDRLKVNL